MSNTLTEREFWVKYWESKKDIALEIPHNYLFHKEITAILQRHNITTAIELGGFPGFYTVFLKKYFQIDVSLLDYFIHPPIIAQLLEKNGLTPADINVIEADLFQYQSPKKYDLVLSCGLIEHFKDTKDIIQRHSHLLSEKGVLFITLPNFTSLNGWVQKKFDIENYNKHYIECMNPSLLVKIALELGLKNVKSYYTGGFSLWLENKSEKNFLVKAFVKSMWLVGKVVSKVLRIESRYTSPYIVLYAEK